MDVAEFERIVRIGLGRAILDLQTHDPEPYRDVIMQATLHNWQYSSSDDTHERYLLDLIELTGDPLTYRTEILRSLDELATNGDSKFEYSPAYLDARQLCAVARLLASKGDDEARQAIRNVLAHHPTEDYLVYELIKLDGERAVPFLAGILGARLSVEHKVEGWRCAHVASLLGDEFGQERVQEILATGAAINPNVATFLTALESDDVKPPPGQPRSDPRGLDYDGILGWMTDGVRSDHRGPYPWNSWGKYAENDDLLGAANALLAMSDDDPLLLRHVQLFGRRGFPLDPQRLIDLARRGRDVDTFDRTKSSLQDLIAVDALFALERIRHPRVRDFALELIAENRWSGWSTDILLTNFEDGDLATINSHILRTSDPHDLHSIVMALWSFYKENRPPGIEETMLLCYEHGPSDFYRWLIVREMLDNGSLPDWVKAECRYDANPETRELFEPEASQNADQNE